MKRTLSGMLLAVALVGSLADRAGAVAMPGDPAPNFTKSELDSPSFGLTTPRSLTDYLGKVVILFELGYNCGVCLADGSSVEADLWDYYQATHPGEVVLLGPDVWNGMASQLRQFRSSTGASYPLLLNGGTSTGGNLTTLYGPNDNYVVINKAGVVRFNTIIYPHGDRYRLSEIRACVDSLVSPPLDVSGASARGFSLRSLPNPFRTHTVIELANPRATAVPARVAVHDLQGRRVATLWDGPAASGVTRVSWDGRDGRGVAMAAGVYVLRGEIDGVTLSRRVTRVR